MRKKLFTLCLVILTSISTMFAEKVQIGDLYYYLDEENKTAEVQSSVAGVYSGDIIIPESVSYEAKTYSVASIGGSAFAFCTGLTSIDIPNSVTSIEYWAFTYCTGLISIEIPNSVTSIEERAFSYCIGLTSMSVEIGNPVYDSRDNCNAIIETASNTLVHGCQNTIIPSSVTSIGARAFHGCTGLTSIEIPNSVTSIGDKAFYDVPNIVYSGTVIGSPWGAKSVNGYVDGYLVYSDDTKTNLIDCSTAAIGEIIIPNSITSIGDDVFRDCIGMTSIVIPNSVSSIGIAAFYNSGLTSVTLPNNGIQIGNAAFQECYGLTTVTIPSGNIPAWAFMDCVNLTSITIGDGVTSIGFQAFYQCTSLPSIIIGKNVNDINWSAFSNCNNLSSIKVASENTTYDSRGDCNAIIETATNTLFIGIKSTIIPNGIDSISESAFYNRCGLTSITIPNSVTGIGYGAFQGCVDLSSITCEAVTPPTLGDNVFYGVNRSIPLYVPAESVDAYKAADQWKDFDVQAIGGGTTPTIVIIADGEDENLSDLDPAGTQFIEEIIVELGGELNVDDANIHIGKLVVVTDGTNSGQVHHGAEGINADHIYLEYILNPCGEFASPNRWYAISVPFEVDIATGISRTCDDKTLVSGTDFLIKEYNGTLRALLGHGWSDRLDGSLNAGQFYMIGIDGTCNRWRFEKKAGQPFEGDTHVGYDEYASSNPLDKGWNGLGNTMLEYMRMNMGASGINYMVTYDNCYGRFVTHLIADLHLCVGRPFFIQASSTGYFDFFFGNTLNNMPALYATPQATTPLMHFTLSDETQSTGIDHLYLTLHEDATLYYTIGRDVARMTKDCKTAAQLWCTMSDGTELSAHGIEMPETETIVPLTLFAPKDSEYLVNMSSRAMEGYDVELLHNGAWVATFYDAQPVTLDLSAGTNSGYVLRISRRNIPTGIEDVQGDNVQSTKVIMNDHLYILRAGLMYDAQGKKVK